MTDTMDRMVAAVKAHAIANYEKGWDYVVECYEDSEIAEQLTEEGATTVAEALKSFGENVALREDRRADIEATIF
jgi:hypothetical protein